MILVCGEALIDLVPADPPRTDHALVPRLGGGPFNTGVALGRLGVATGFCGRFSTDGFGRRLRAALADAGVDLSLAAEGPENTSLAVVDLDDAGNARYRFYVEGTADRRLGPADVPTALPVATRACHFGTLSLVLEPGATTLERLMVTASTAGLVVALDPNVRPALIADRDAYRRRLTGWLGLADVVKVSADDLAWLEPDEAVPAVLERWCAHGPSVVVCTAGPAEATAMGPRGLVTVPAPPVTVADTIGAGDAFNAGLLAWLDGHDRLDPEALGALAFDELSAAVGFAVAVAASTCTRPGADPPWRDELDPTVSS